MIEVQARLVAAALGVNDVEAVELVAQLMLKLQDAPDKGRFLKDALRRALIEPDMRRPR